MKALLQAPRSARHLVVWCLLVALPVYGLSGALVQMLGAQHVHLRMAAGQDSLAGWEDFRRSLPHRVAAATAHAHGHAAFERHHHAPDDASVSALGGTSSDDAGSSPAGASALVLALAPQAPLPLPGATRADWPSLALLPIHSCDTARLERPPRG